MRYAFDLDGTLDVPEIAGLANALHAAGHEVYVVTGAVTDTGEWTMEARIEKCARLGVKYTKIIRCFGDSLDAIGAKKAQALKELGAALMFEDSIPFAQHTVQACPTLLVVPRG